MDKIRVTLGLVSALFVAALLSCGMQIPESVTVKGTPGLYVPLGSPFAGSGEGGGAASFSDYLSEAKIREMLGDDENMDLVAWDDPDHTGVQAYRVRYRVADINTDLSEYASKLEVGASESDLGGFIPGTGAPVALPLPLKSMSWAHSITNVTIGVKLTFLAAVDLSQVSVVFGGAASGGTPAPTSGSVTEVTYTSNQIAMFNPETDEVTAAIKAPAGVYYKPELVFNWATATIALEDGAKEGAYPINFSSFGSFLGEGTEFAAIDGYLYQHASGSNLTISGTLGASNDKYAMVWEDGTTESVHEVSDELLWGSDYTRPNPTNDPDTELKIDLTGLFDQGLTFNYGLNVQEVAINSAESSGTNKSSSQIYLVILLPMKFALTGEPALYTDMNENPAGFYSGDYRKLDLEMLQGMGGDGSDLLGRSGGGDDMFSDIEYITLSFYDYSNNIIDGLFLGITTGEHTQFVPLNTTTLKLNDITFKQADTAYPFAPKFELLVPAGTDATSTFQILNPGVGKEAKIDFSISVEAKTALDYQVF
jgi:hypothetical protein